MMNKRKSNRWAMLKVLLFLPLIALMVHSFAQKEIKSASTVIPTQPQGKFLILKPEQLKILGFEYNSEGLFYKNERPDEIAYKGLDLIFTKKVYSCSIRIKKGEKPGHFPGNKVIDKMTATTFDFVPYVVSNFKGQRTITTVPMQKHEKEKLLPVEVHMADLQIIGRSDTVVFWFNPTESLMKILAPIFKIDDYLQICPPYTPSDAMVKGKKGK